MYNYFIRARCLFRVPFTVAFLLLGTCTQCYRTVDVSKKKKNKKKNAYCADNRFWLKATIIDYNLWTAAPANLKSLARVVVDIRAKMYPDCPYYNFYSKHKHCYVCCTLKSPFMPNTWPHSPSQWARYLPKCLNKSSIRQFDGKDQQDSHF